MDHLQHYQNVTKNCKKCAEEYPAEYKLLFSEEEIRKLERELEAYQEKFNSQNVLIIRLQHIISLYRKGIDSTLGPLFEARQQDLQHQSGEWKL
jgi:collagenase-like PrtC family protease